jgi:hypothetical protein
VELTLLPSTRMEGNVTRPHSKFDGGTREIMTGNDLNKNLLYMYEATTDLIITGRERGFSPGW